MQRAPTATAGAANAAARLLIGRFLSLDYMRTRQSFYLERILSK